MTEKASAVYNDYLQLAKPVLNPVQWTATEMRDRILRPLSEDIFPVVLYSKDYIRE
jgi:hypothetical protein